MLYITPTSDMQHFNEMLADNPVALSFLGEQNVAIVAAESAEPYILARKDDLAQQILASLTEI